ncbi:MAG: hypothetical protein ABWY66_16685, partial [Xanthobacteraceae bacterium]
KSADVRRTSEATKERKYDVNTDIFTEINYSNLKNDEYIILQPYPLTVPLYSYANYAKLRRNIDAVAMHHWELCSLSKAQGIRSCR